MTFSPLDAVLLVLLAGACWTDITTQKIRNVLTFPVMLAGIALAPMFAPAWWWGLAGWGVAAALTIPLFAFGAIKAGDVKMLAAAGALLGPEMGARAVLISLIVGLPAGLLVMAVRGRLGNLYRFFVKRDTSQVTIVAHAPVLALGILIARLQPWPDLW